MKVFDILTNNFDNMSNFDRLFYKFLNAYEPTYHEYAGTVPTTITADGAPLLSWIIYGNKENGVFCGEKTENLLNASTCTDGYEIGNGTLQPNAEWCVSDFVSVDVGKTYFGSNTGGSVILYDSQKNKTRSIGGLVASGITVDTNEAYIRVNLKIANKSIAIVSIDSRKPYEPYGYKIPIVCGGVTTPVYIGDEPLKMSNDETTFDEVNSTGVVIHRVDSDGNILETPTTTIITPPEIPTTDGAQTFDVDTTVSPSSVHILYY